MKALGVSNTLVDSISNEVSLFAKNASEVALAEEQSATRENAAMLSNFRSYEDHTLSNVKDERDRTLRRLASEQRVSEASEQRMADAVRDVDRGLLEEKRQVTESASACSYYSS